MQGDKHFCPLRMQSWRARNAGGVRSTGLGATWSAPATWGTVNSYGTPPPAIWFEVRGRAILCSTITQDWLTPWIRDYGLGISTDGGVTWRGAAGPSWWQVVTNLNTFYGGPRFCGFDGELYCFKDVFSRLLFVHLAGTRSLGDASGGGGAQPKLAIDRVPLHDADTRLELRDGRPGAPALIVYGLPAPPVPLVGGTLVVLPTAVFFAQLQGSASPSPGTVTLTFRPAWEIASGGFGVQAFVLDPGAPGGVAVSDGMVVRCF